MSRYPVAPQIGYFDTEFELYYCFTCYPYEGAAHFELIEEGQVRPVFGSDIGPYDPPYYCTDCGENLHKRDKRKDVTT